MDKECQVAGCASPVRVKSRGWCNLHYQRWRRTGDPLKVAWVRGDHASNFWAKVTRLSDSECWPFTGYISTDGYGSFIWPGGQLAHRFAFELIRGPIPGGMDLDHVCHSGSDCTASGKNCPHRRCVNPAHLEPISPPEHKASNKAGMRGAVAAARGRAKTHCPKGHEYTEENTYVDSRGCRNCRACQREKNRVANQTDERRTYQREYQREYQRARRARSKA